MTCVVRCFDGLHNLPLAYDDDCGDPRNVVTVEARAMHAEAAWCAEIDYQCCSSTAQQRQI